MTKIEILGANRFKTYTKTREASRALIVQDGMILLIYEAGSDLWIIPGGGIEKNETPENVCSFIYLRQQKTCHEDRPALVVHSLTIPPISFHQTENCHESSNKVLLNANRNTNERQSHNTNLIKRKNCKEKDKLGLYQYDRVQEIDMLLIIGFE